MSFREVSLVILRLCSCPDGFALISEISDKASGRRRRYFKLRRHQEKTGNLSLARQPGLGCTAPTFARMPNPPGATFCWLFASRPMMFTHPRNISHFPTPSGTSMFSSRTVMMSGARYERTGFCRWLSATASNRPHGASPLARALPTFNHKNMPRFMDSRRARAYPRARTAVVVHPAQDKAPVGDYGIVMSSG